MAGPRPDARPFDHAERLVREHAAWALARLGVTDRRRNDAARTARGVVAAARACAVVRLGADGG